MQSGTDKWMPATVPGTVHQDLLDNALIPNPFYGTNEYEINWVENADWEYRTVFRVTEKEMEHDAALLTFEGLDTYADVYLNGSLLLKADNMFVGYSIPVKEVLKVGENRLHVRFRSPVRETLPQWESNGFDYPADNDHADKRLSVFSRKAPYSYGWDWGIRMVTSGIWRPVTLRFYNVASIADYHVKQISLTDKRAETSNVLEVNSAAFKEEAAMISIACSLQGGEVKSVDYPVTLRPGFNRIEVPLVVENPVRWMPNGWGTPLCMTSPSGWCAVAKRWLPPTIASDSALCAW